MAIKIDNKTIPASMANRGQYRFPAADLVRRDGNGLGIASPTRSIEWVFPYMTASELDFWITTVLAGEPSKLCTDNIFNDPTAAGVETAFSTCILDRPQMANSPVSGRFRNVTINIRSVIS